MSFEPWSPVDVEQRLRQSVTDMTKAELTLRNARDAETDAELAYKRKFRSVLLSPQCPKVTRGGFTVTERDAWVEQQCAEAWEAYRLAQTTCQSAQDHVRRVRDVAVAIQSIGALVRTGYSIAGSS